MRKYALACLSLAIPLSASAADLAGTYKGSGHFGTVEISARGSNFLLTTCGFYGNRCLSITAELKETAEGQFASIAASLTGYYGNFHCEYPIRLQVTQDDNRIYLSEFGPSYFPASFRGCPDRSLLRYAPYVEPKPYSREQN